VASAGQHQTIAAEEPLKAVSAEFEEVEEEAKILISTGREPLERTLQTVKHAVGLTLEEAGPGTHEGLRITSKDGSVTTVSFRSSPFPGASRSGAEGEKSPIDRQTSGAHRRH